MFKQVLCTNTVLAREKPVSQKFYQLIRGRDKEDPAADTPPEHTMIKPGIYTYASSADTPPDVGERTCYSQRLHRCLAIICPYAHAS